MQKTFVLDTNILLSNPNSIFQFDDNDLVIPIAVIEEVDHFKKNQNETGRNAREVSRILDRLRQRGNLAKGIPIHEERENTGSIFVYIGHNSELLPSGLNDSIDNHILSVALHIQKEQGDKRKVILVSKDANLRIKGDALGVDAENYEADKMDISHLYTGTASVPVEAEAINDFYAKREVAAENLLVSEDNKFYPNQYIYLHEKEDPTQKVFGVYDADSAIVRMLDTYSEGVWGVFPRNTEQSFALEALLNDDIKVVTLSGGAGTGKTLLAIAAGLHMTTDEDKYQKLLVSRPIFPMGKDVGYLPGDIDEKLNPWMQPVFDNLELLLSGGVTSRPKRFSKSYEELIKQGILAVEPLTYIRGRSLPNQYFIVDEAQNLTPHEVKTILTRAGDGTKVVLTGDPYQIDHAYLDSENNGLTFVIERLKKSKISAHVTLTKGERSELASLAADLL
jgi:PhoH-like ATPase